MSVFEAFGAFDSTFESVKTGTMVVTGYSGVGHDSLTCRAEVGVKVVMYAGNVTCSPY